ncbi:hypothetical protein BDF20DRAFT_955566, partial [Mycotypha africana]|uniref:uncharacterized protein n=1 Tax=Mycotypha africana TaxID=64632 RepID=UPI0022FFF08C
MKSVTLATPADKDIIRQALPTSKIYTAAVARLHVASPDPSKWTYSQIWGAAVFCCDKAKNNSFFIRIVELQGQNNVIWEQELYYGFQYVKDASFFHSFETDDCLTALEFVDEGEADVFYKKGAARQTAAPVSKAGLGDKKTSSLVKRKSKVDKNLIGMPADFRHLGHIGYTPGKGFSVQNNDPEWNSLFDQLKELGITAEEIDENQEFIQEFLEQNKQQTQQHPVASINKISSPPPPKVPMPPPSAPPPTNPLMPPPAPPS